MVGRTKIYDYGQGTGGGLSEEVEVGSGYFDGVFKIGSSSVAAAIGLSELASAQKEWRRHTGNETEAEKKPNRYVDDMLSHGNFWEDAAIDLVRAHTLEEFAYTGSRESGLQRSCSFSIDDFYVRSTPDGVGYDCLCEVKCPHGKMYDDLMPRHLVQNQVHMTCTHRDDSAKSINRVLFAAYKPNGNKEGKFTCWEQLHSEYLEDLILENLRKYYANSIVANVAPRRFTKKNPRPEIDRTKISIRMIYSNVMEEVSI